MRPGRRHGCPPASRLPPRLWPLPEKLVCGDRRCVSSSRFELQFGAAAAGTPLPRPYIEQPCGAATLSKLYITLNCIA